MRRSNRSWRYATAAVLSAALVASLASATPANARSHDPLDGVPVPEIDWKSCGEKKLQDFRCATVEVPSDYDDPHGATTTIALTKLPATDPDRRIGSLFTNPGGPGGSGVGFVHSSGKTAYTPKVRKRFDIIGFDPRGVAGSDPATCYANAEEEQEATRGMVPFPFGAKQEKRYTAFMADLAKDCAAQSGDRIAHSSTANVARDMDLLRRAVGDKKLNYVGYSYGTYLGATYARLFPDNIRALVLDGTVDPPSYAGRRGDKRSLGARGGQGPAASETYGEFLRLCREAGPKRCALAELGNPRKVMRATFRSLKKDPVTVKLPDGTRFKATYPNVVGLAFNGLYSPAGWSDLSSTLALVASKSTASAQRSAKTLGLRRLYGDVAEYLRQLRSEDYPSIGGSLASMCVDTEHPLDPKDYPAQADREAAEAPHFGRFRSWVGIQCERMGVTDRDAYTGPWKQQTDKPVLVIGTRYDPATPYKYTRPYTDRFSNGRMLTLDGWGHTILGQSECADRRVARYLMKRKARDGAVCRPDSQPFAQQAAERDGYRIGAPAPVW